MESEEEEGGTNTTCFMTPNELQDHKGVCYATGIAQRLEAAKKELAIGRTRQALAERIDALFAVALHSSAQTPAISLGLHAEYYTGFQ